MRRRRFPTPVRQALLALLLAAAIAVPAAALPFQLPALNEAPTGEHHVGKMIYAELVTPDLAAAMRFYGQLFGWSFAEQQGDGITYASASLDGRPVAGLIQKALPRSAPRAPAWLTLMAVSDADAAEATALAHGAKLLFAPHDLPNLGRKAVLADPQGAVFALLASASGDPPDYLAAPGEWIWSSLITTDPDKDAAFYQALFGFDVFELPADPGAEHLLLASHNYARASVNSLPGKDGDNHPHWINFIRVLDADKTAAQVVALGGRVLVQPRLDRHGGKVALVADPAGAPFGLLEWAAGESKEVPK